MSDDALLRRHKKYEEDEKRRKRSVLRATSLLMFLGKWMALTCVH